jgi:hypothetical protein
MRDQCDQCQFEMLEHFRGLNFCPRCGNPLTSSDPNEAWTNVVKFQSVAEAGFYADQLTADHILNRVMHESEFDEALGQSFNTFMLQVKKSDSDAAREIVRNSVKSDPAGTDPIDDDDGLEARPRPSILAKSLPLLATTGFGFVLGLVICLPSLTRSPLEQAASRDATLQSVPMDKDTPNTDSGGAGQTLKFNSRAGSVIVTIDETKRYTFRVK